METLWQDLKYGARMLAKNRGFTLVAVVTLALGIGANTAIFSLVNAILLRPLPGVERPQELVRVYSTGERTRFSNFSYPDYADFRDRTSTLAGLAAYGSINVSLTQGDSTELVQGEIVSGNYFEVLGTRPTLGRVFLPEEDGTPGTHPVVVLGDALWKRRFGGDPGIVGRTIILNGMPFNVVGVAPAGFNSVEPGRVSTLWIPLMMQGVVRPPSAGLRRSIGGFDLLAQRGPSWLNVVGRLKQGAGVKQAQADLDVVADGLAQAFPQTNQGQKTNVIPMKEAPGMRTQAFPILAVLMSVVGVVLLIACANVANLLLARAAARRKEIAIRLAMGAGRGRMIRQLLTESVMLASLGAAAGILLAMWGMDLFRASGIPLSIDLRLDARVLLFALGLAVLTGVVFGLVPALQAARSDLVLTLKDEAGQVAGGSRQSRLRTSLVIAQVALSLVLLVGAGLFLRTLRNAQTVDPGFDPDRVLALAINFDVLRYTEAQGTQFYGQITERLEAVPGVQSVTLARLVPLSGGGRGYTVQIPGRESLPDGGAVQLSANVVGLKYFETLRIPILRGRDFAAQDTQGAPRVAILSETGARTMWPGEEALGKQFRMGGPNTPLIEVVGVARDVRFRNLKEEPVPFLYLPLLQNYESVVNVHIRSALDPKALADPIRREVMALDKNLPVYSVQTLYEYMNERLFGERALASLLGFFGLLALLLAGVGLYGVMAFTVAQRMHEIGIRMALGAQPGNILGMVLRQGMRHTAIGALVGLAASLALTRLVASLLFGVTPTDPLTFGGVVIVLAIVALAACWIPARRATRVDPMVALRYE